MTISLQSTALRVGKGIFRSNFTGTATDTQWSDILLASNWTVEKWNGAAWAADTTALSDVRRPDVDADYIEFRIKAPDGAYFLESSEAGITANLGACYFREQSASHEPFKIVIEGALEEIPYWYLDQDAFPEGVSQSLDMREGITQDDSMDLVLVDIDGWITSNFEPNQFENTTTLDGAITDSQNTIDLVDGDEFDGNGTGWLDRECITYSGKTGDQLTGVSRGQNNTQARPHGDGTTFYDYMPNLRGRWLQVQDQAGNIIYGGIISQWTPGSNLATYDVSVEGTLSALDSTFASVLTAGQVAKQFVLSEKQKNGKDTGDTFFRMQWDYAISGGSRAVDIRLKPGLYDIEPNESPEAGHIAFEFQRAINDAMETWSSDNNDLIALKITRASVSEEYRLKFTVGVAAEIWFIHGDTNDALPRLGFDPEEDLYIGPGDIIETFTSDIENKDPLSTGIGPQSVEIPLEAAFLNLQGSESFGNSDYVQIDDEIISYGSVDEGEDASDTLDAGVGITSVTQKEVYLDDTTGFAEGDFIEVGDEVIFLGRILSGTPWLAGFTNCTRACMGTTAATHVEGAAVTKMPIPRLTDCVRGHFGTEKNYHSTGAGVAEIACSDFIDANDVLTPLTPFEWLAGLIGIDNNAILWTMEGVPDVSLFIPEDIVNADSFEEIQWRTPMNANHSFLAISGADESYRDVLSNIARPLNAFLYIDNDGKIAINRFKVILKHQNAEHTLVENDLLAGNPPTIEWKEDSRVQRMSVDLGRRPGSSEYENKLILNNSTEKNKFFQVYDAVATLDAGYYYGSTSSVREFSDFDTWLVMLSTDITTRYSRFLYEVRLATSLDNVADIKIGDRVTLTHSKLPTGNGNRTLSANLSVIEYRKNLENKTAELRLSSQPAGNYPGWNFSALVTAYNAGGPTITISQSNWWNDDNGLTLPDILSPSDSLLVKQVAAGRISGGPIAVTLDASAIPEWVAGSATLTLTGAPGTAPAANDILVAAAYDTVGAVSLQDFAYIADANGELGAANDDGHEYVPMVG